MNRSVCTILIAAGMVQLLGSIHWAWRALSSAPDEASVIFEWMLAAGMLMAGAGMLLIGILGWRQTKMKADRNG